MGRPTPSHQNTSIAVCIAMALCKQTNLKLDLVARSGKLSLFQAVKEIFPAGVRTATCRDGISEVHLNKTLQKAGFKRIRDRRVHVIKRIEDPVGAGMYLFSKLCWRDPNDEADRAELVTKWELLLEKHPKIAKRCTLDRFLDIIDRFQKEWKTYLERIDARRNAEVEDVELSDGESSSDSLADATRTASETTPTPTLMSQQTADDTSQQRSRLQLELALATAQTLALVSARSACTAMASNLVRLQTKPHLAVGIPCAPVSSLPPQQLSYGTGFPAQVDMVPTPPAPTFFCRSAELHALQRSRPVHHTSPPSWAPPSNLGSSSAAYVCKMGNVLDSQTNAHDLKLQASLRDLLLKAATSNGPLDTTCLALRGLPHCDVSKPEISFPALSQDLNACLFSAVHDK